MIKSAQIHTDHSGDYIYLEKEEFPIYSFIPPLNTIFSEIIRSGN